MKTVQDIIDSLGYVPDNKVAKAIMEAFAAGRRSNVKRRALIGLCGKAGSGKDTAADGLVHVAQRVPYKRLSFAGPLKTMLIASGILTKEQTENRDLKESTLEWCGKSPRQLMQTLGTEWGRQCVHTDFWLLLAQKELDAAIGPVVFTDVRFENEAQFIRDNGGLVVHVERPEMLPITGLHTSESGIKISPDDKAVLNFSDIDNLHRLIRTVADEWCKV